MISLSDPDGAHPLVTGIAWLQATLLGSLATVVAVIAVAGVGALMLTGRLDWRRGATVVLGCFVLFGANSIASGIGSGSGAATATYVPASPPVMPIVTSRFPTQRNSPGFDPYAGAAPTRPSQPTN